MAGPWPWRPGRGRGGAVPAGPGPWQPGRGSARAIASIAGWAGASGAALAAGPGLRPSRRLNRRLGLGRGLGGLAGAGRPGRGRAAGAGAAPAGPGPWQPGWGCARAVASNAGWAGCVGRGPGGRAWAAPQPSPQSPAGLGRRSRALAAGPGLRRWALASAAGPGLRRLGLGLGSRGGAAPQLSPQAPAGLMGAGRGLRILGLGWWGLVGGGSGCGAPPGCPPRLAH